MDSITEHFVTTDQNESKPATNPKSFLDIEKIMELMLYDKWEEVQSEYQAEIEKPYPNRGAIAISPLINSRCNLLDDLRFKEAERFLSPEWQQSIEQARNKILSLYYLEKCIEDNSYKNEEELCHSSTPLIENENFQNSKRYASPERLKELEEMQYKQAEFFLLQCIQNNGVSCEADLQGISSPVIDDKMFQNALEFASPERQVLLHGIIQEQGEFFVRKCMEDNNVVIENDLKYASIPLSFNINYKNALKLLSSDRKEVLIQLQYAQAENIFKQYLFDNKELLMFKKEKLNKDAHFQMFYQIASQEFQNTLETICAAQEKEQLRQITIDNQLNEIYTFNEERDKLSERINELERQNESKDSRLKYIKEENNKIEQILKKKEEQFNEERDSLTNQLAQCRKRMGKKGASSIAIILTIIILAAIAGIIVFLGIMKRINSVLDEDEEQSQRQRYEISL